MTTTPNWRIARHWSRRHGWRPTSRSRSSCADAGKVPGGSESWPGSGLGRAATERPVDVAYALGREKASTRSRRGQPLRNRVERLRGPPVVALRGGGAPQALWDDQLLGRSQEDLDKGVVRSRLNSESRERGTPSGSVLRGCPFNLCTRASFSPARRSRSSHGLLALEALSSLFCLGRARAQASPARRGNGRGRRSPHRS